MKLVAFINTAHLLCHYCLLILPTAVLAMAARDGAFGVDYGPILELATAMFVLYGLLSLPQGWLAARFGRRTMIAAYFFGTGGVRPWRWTDSGLCFDRLPGVLILELHGTEITQRRVQPS